MESEQVQPVLLDAATIGVIRKIGAGLMKRLLLVVMLITALSGYFFLARTWWFPIDITQYYGHAIDRQFLITLVTTGIIFVAAQAALL
jgi:hypothetical protein